MYGSFVHYRILTYELPVESLKIVYEAESDNALGTIHKLLHNHEVTAISYTWTIRHWMAFSN